MLFNKSSKKEYQDPVVNDEYQRGLILDRNGEILAMNIPYLSVIANPRQISDPADAAARLSAILGLPVEDLYLKLSKDTGYAVLKRKINFSLKESLTEALRDSGYYGEVYIQEYQGRFYPSNFHAAQIIGFTDIDGNGIEGIELALNDKLTAQSVINKEISYGDDVYLTLDIQLQYICDSVVQNMYQTHDPDYAVLLLMDAKTGEILASTSYPWYNLNTYSLSTQEDRQNKVFTYIYEPGSVFKIFSLASCLEIGESPLNPYDCTGIHVFDTTSGKKLTIGCHEEHGLVDYAGMIKKSCNGAIASWALETSDSKFYDELSLFNFGKRYNIELYNSSGLLSDPSQWSFRSKPTISFGQEISATVLQLATAATVFTNDGILLKPAIVSKVVNQYQEVTQAFERTELNSVVSSDVASKILAAMESATQEGGTAIKTSVDGLRVAAKTGTAEILDSSNSAVTASTLAIFPADDPQYIVYVAASNPKGSTIWGANIASPAIGELIDAMVSAGKLISQRYNITE